MGDTLGQQLVVMLEEFHLHDGDWGKLAAAIEELRTTDIVDRELFHEIFAEVAKTEHAY